MGRAERIEIAATQALANLVERGHGPGLFGRTARHDGCQECWIARTLADALDAEPATVDQRVAR